MIERSSMFGRMPDLGSQGIVPILPKQPVVLGCIRSFGLGAVLLRWLVYRSGPGHWPIAASPRNPALISGHTPCRTLDNSHRILRLDLKLG